MNPQAAKVTIDCLLKGAFDLFDAMLSRSFSYEAGEAQPVDLAALEDLAASYPVVLRGAIQGGLGAVALMLRAEEAGHIAALAVEAAPAAKAALDDDDRAALLEVAGPALGSGVTNLMERAGRNVEQLEEVEVDDSESAPVALSELLGEDAVAATFSFQGDDLAGDAVVLFSGGLENLLPDAALADDTGGPEEVTLSDAEMTDILSGFDTAAADAPVGGGRAAPDNLDMVLDIGLVATARLGRVELPLSEVLNLGPGSIIEVGHMVDEPVELLVNGKLIARGDVVVVDEKFGLRITEIVSQRERIESMQ